MKKSTLYLKAGTNILLYIVALLLIVFLLPRVLAYFMPFVIGWIVSLIANVPVRFLENKIKFKRKASSAIMIVLIIALIISAGYGVIAVLVEQGAGLVSTVIEKWPEWQVSLKNMGLTIKTHTKLLPSNMTGSLDNLGTTIENYLSNFVASLGTPSVNMISSFAKSLPAVVVSVIMCLLSAYFFTADRTQLTEKLNKAVSPSFKRKLDAAYRGFTKAFGGYILSQLKIEFWVYIILTIGLLIINLQYALVIALIIALLDFLPFIGAGIIMVPWAIILLLNGDYFMAVGMFITWVVAQLVRQIIQPKIVGETVGLSSIPTLFLLYIGYMSAGFLGMIIAIPVGMIFVALYEEGVFTSFTESIKIIWDGISQFRKIPENITENEKEDAEEENSK